MDSPTRILVAPLDWGLGHATRCIPLIDGLLAEGKEVILAGSGRSLLLLQEAYPELEKVELPAYRVRYGKGRQQITQIVRQVPRLLRVIQAEHARTERMVQELGIEAIISDNRYGVWARGVPSTFICHQLAVMAPPLFAWARKLVYHLHLRAMRPFQEIWVPDAQGKDSLSGDLSQRYPIPTKVRFIGPLSRFAGKTAPATFSLKELNEQTPDIVAVLSGPEPQRSLLEEKIWTQAQQQERAVWIVAGKPEATEIEWQGIHARIPFLATTDLHRLLLQARLVISRSGYSSLMDYESLGLKNVALIPTPGQTEQEYLAQSLARKGKAMARNQWEFKLEEVLQSS